MSVNLKGKLVEPEGIPGYLYCPRILLLYFLLDQLQQCYRSDCFAVQLSGLFALLCGA